MTMQSLPKPALVVADMQNDCVRSERPPCARGTKCAMCISSHLHQRRLHVGGHVIQRGQNPVQHGGEDIFQRTVHRSGRAAGALHQCCGQLDLLRLAHLDRCGQPLTARINEIVRERRGITAETALRFARFFGTSVNLWMNLQQRYDLERAKDLLVDSLEQITPMHLAA